MTSTREVAKFIYRVTVNKNYVPCNMEFCKCVNTMNLKDSYTDRFLYKKCYDRNMKFFRKFTDHNYNIFAR